MGEATGTRSAMPTRARRVRDMFAALFFISVAVFCVLVAVVLVPAVDAGEEESAVVIVSVIALVVLGLCVAAAGSLNGLARLPIAVTVFGTVAVTLCWAGLTVWSYLAANASASERPSGLVGFLITSGLTIPAAAVGVVGVIVTSVVGTARVRRGSV